MNHDPRRFGGQEYAPQPVMRRVPQGYQQAPRAPDLEDATAVSDAMAMPPPTQAAPAAVAAVTGAPEADDSSRTVELSRAYMAHGEAITRLTFRKPTGLDLAKYGYPIRHILGADTGRVESIEINAAIAMKYVVALSSPPIPPSTFHAMDLWDADACIGAASGFFLR